MTQLLDTFTSTGSKLFHHQEFLTKLRNKQGMPITTHVMPTDICNYKCAFCSVQYREGDALPLSLILKYLDDLLVIGLKSIIISGGGNPILYKCPATGAKFPRLIDEIHARGLEIGLITNGIKLKDYNGRRSYPTLPPEQLDKLTWLRISLAGWDHPDDECFTPDIDPSKTTLGGSYVLHDIYEEPLDDKHGRVSTPDDLISKEPGVVRYGKDRISELTTKMYEWYHRYDPKYVRLLPNCLEPRLIPERAKLLEGIADFINPGIFFVQVKPPRQPHVCYKGYPHPVLNCDGWVYPCDSVVLNKTAGHKFGSEWRICKAEDIAEFYAQPIRPNVPNTICPGCVFSDQVDLLANIADGMEIPETGATPTHVNFV
jgi:hypothetical protein